MSGNSPLSSPTRLGWWYAYARAGVRLHKRLVLALGFTGAVIGLLVAQTTPRVYSAHVVVQPNSEPFEGVLPVRLSWPVRLMQRVDEAAVQLGLPDPDLGGRASKIFAKN
jgi:hypothetical protein